MKSLKIKFSLSIIFSCLSLLLYCQVEIYPDYFDNFSWSINKHYYSFINSQSEEEKRVKVVLIISNIREGVVHQSETAPFVLRQGLTYISELNFPEYIPLSIIYNEAAFIAAITDKGYPAEGDYSYVLRVVDALEGNILASATNEYGYISNDFFTLLSPLADAVDIPLTTSFQWQDYLANKEDILGHYTYTIVEVNDNQIPQEAFFANLPIATVDNLDNFKYSASSLGVNLEKCKRYAWQVNVRGRFADVPVKSSEIWSFRTECENVFNDSSIVLQSFHPLSESTNSEFYWIKDTLKVSLDNEYGVEGAPQAYIVNSVEEVIPIDLSNSIYPQITEDNYFRPGSNDFQIPLRILALVPYSPYQLVIFDSKKSYYFNFIYYY